MCWPQHGYCVCLGWARVWDSAKATGPHVPPWTGDSAMCASWDRGQCHMCHHGQGTVPRESVGQGTVLCVSAGPEDSAVCVSRARGQSCVCQHGQGTVLCVSVGTGWEIGQCHVCQPGQDSPMCASRDRLRDKTVPHVPEEQGTSPRSVQCALSICAQCVPPLHTQGPGSLALSILFLQPPVTLPASLFLLSFDHSIKIKMEILQNMKSGSQADFWWHAASESFLYLEVFYHRCRVCTCF